MIKAIYAISRMRMANPLNNKTGAKGSGRNILVSINTWPDSLLIAEPEHVRRLSELGYVDHLSLVFGDIVPEDFFRFRMDGNLETPGFRLFSYDDARAIKKFVDKWAFEEINRLVVHCDRGKSRSGAVAAWAFHYLASQGLYGKSEVLFWADNREIKPNEYVAKVLCEIAGMNYVPAKF